MEFIITQLNWFFTSAPLQEGNDTCKHLKAAQFPSEIAHTKKNLRKKNASNINHDAYEMQKKKVPCPSSSETTKNIETEVSQEQRTPSSKQLPHPSASTST